MCEIHQIFCTTHNFSYILRLYRSYLAGFQCEGNQMSYQLQPLQEFNYSINQEQNWQIAYAYKGYGYAIKRADGSTVCNLPDGLRPQEKQLAELICALPQILEALQQHQFSPQTITTIQATPTKPPHLIAVYAIKNSPNHFSTDTPTHTIQYTHYSADGQLTPQATELLKDFYLAL